MNMLLQITATFSVVLSCYFVCGIVAETRQQFYEHVKLFGEKTCIVNGSQPTSFQVNFALQCPAGCMHESCTMYNLKANAGCSLKCEIFDDVSHYAYNVPNCEANQVLTPGTLDFTQTAWLIIQTKVISGSVSFNRTWIEYKNGFGDPTAGDNYWIGNEVLHQLTTTKPGILRVEVQKSNVWYWAAYSNFALSSEASNYILDVSGYSGNAGDALVTAPDGWINNGKPFSTYDRVNHESWCDCEPGWWSWCCSGSQVNSDGNGIWMNGGSHPFDVSSSRRHIMKAAHSTVIQL